MIPECHNQSTHKKNLAEASNITYPLNLRSVHTNYKTFVLEVGIAIILIIIIIDFEAP